MHIQLDSNQAGTTGDMVPSMLKAGGKKHYVSPKITKDMEMFSSLPFMQSLSPFVVLKASSSESFAKDFKWEGATPIPGTPHKARVSRLIPGHFRVKIKRKSNGNIEDELNVWIVWCETNPENATVKSNERGAIIDKGKEYFRVKMGYEFVHTIKPETIISLTADVPDLSGDKSSPVPPLGGLTYHGAALKDGVEKKWDCSRQVRQKVLNPSRVPIFYDKSHNYPDLFDGDGRPGGAGAISFRDLMVTGNDDYHNDDEDNDPYRPPYKGKLHVIDRPERTLLQSDGANGNTVEWRLHFVEFVRLEINGKWYLISDHFPWRLHFKVKKVGGKWRDNGSRKATDNDRF